MTEAHTAGTAGGSVMYEYTTVRVDRELESLYRDTYANFGWVVEGYGSMLPSASTVLLRLKRPRHIKNRPQVVELQRKAERALAEITGLEHSKGTAAIATSLSIGIVGSAFLAGSVFAIDADRWGVSIPLGMVGLILWLVGYLAHGRVKARRVAKVTPQIDGQYDVIYETSEQAARLLA